MDIKEVIETLRGWIEARHLFSSFHRKDLEGLLAFIKSQQERLDTQKDEIAKLVIDVNRLSELEEKCPDCGGHGEIYWTDTDVEYDNDGEPYQVPVQARDICPTCSGSGKVPVCYLPDWFVEKILLLEGYPDSQNSVIWEILKRGYFYPKKYSLKKQPNNRWKLEQIKST